VNSFTNNATLETKNGAALTINSLAWTNAGTLTINDGTLNLAGSFTNASLGTISRMGGVVNLMGALTNTTLLLNAVTGSWNLFGGTIVGGTVAFADGARLVTTSSGGIFNGVTLNSDITIGNGQILSIVNGLTLNAVLTLASSGLTTELRFNPGAQMLGGTGEVVTGGTGLANRILVGNGGAATLTLGGRYRDPWPGLDRSEFGEHLDQQRCDQCGHLGPDTIGECKQLHQQWDDRN
jgi:hypothetical protein